jgi:hypothetical protein
MANTRSDLYGILDDSSFPELAPEEHRAVRERASRRAPKQTTPPSTAGGMALVAACLVTLLTEKLLGVSYEGGVPTDPYAYRVLLAVSVLGFLAGWLPSKAKEKAHYQALKDEFEAALRMKQTVKAPTSPSSLDVPRNQLEPSP